jgi:hypothetical protein
MSRSNFIQANGLSTTLKRRKLLKNELKLDELNDHIEILTIYSITQY